MRPAILHVGGVLYWTIQTRDPDTMLLKDADSTPTVAVRKNGAAVGDSVTITKRAATTGLYDCEYNPAAEVEGDTFQFEESAAVTGTTTAQATYTSQFSVRAVHAGAVELDSSVTDQITAIETAIELLRVSDSRVVERSVSDENAITFAWPVSGATITGERSINNGIYAAVQGSIAFLRTESSKHYYTLAFDADDRPTAEGQVRYKFVDGTYTRYVVLRVALAGLSTVVQEQIDNIETVVEGIANQTDLITGPGEDQVTIEIVDDGIGVDDVSVWITSDSGGAAIVAGSSVTNGSGQVTFLLTAGTSYYLWASKTGKISIQGRLFTAVAD